MAMLLPDHEVPVLSSPVPHFEGVDILLPVLAEKPPVVVQSNGISHEYMPILPIPWQSTASAAAAISDDGNEECDTRNSSDDGSGAVDAAEGSPRRSIRTGNSWSAWFLELPAKERNLTLKEHCPNITKLDINGIRKEVQRLKQNAAQQRCVVVFLPPH
jgi:hypothetical protein